MKLFRWKTDCNLTTRSVIIIVFSQILALALGRIRQPRVIAEVIGGILLGPTVMGRIPHFKDTIFPQDSMAILNLTSTVGLILFLFLVGLEIDAAVIKRNARLSVSVALAGMSIPFGLGAALSVPLYHRFIDPSVKLVYALNRSSDKLVERHLEALKSHGLLDDCLSCPKFRIIGTDISKPKLGLSPDLYEEVSFISL